MKQRNRNRLQKAKALSLILLVLAVVTACTGGGNNRGAVAANNDGNAINQGTGAETRSSASDPPAAVDQSTIRGEVKVLSIFAGGAIEQFDTMMKEFNKEYPNVKVTHMSQGINDLPALISAGENPDVLISDGGRFPLTWITDGLIQDMKPLMEKDPEITADLFYESVFNRGLGLQGQVWQMPYTVEPNFVMVYNQDILELYGDTEMPEINNLQEFDELLKKYWVVENGTQVMTTFSPIELYGDLNSLMTMAYLNGADQNSFYNAETNTATFNDPKIVEALEWLIGFKREHINDERLAELHDSLPENTSRFTAGKSLFQPSVTSEARGILATDPDVQMKAMPAESLWFGGAGISMSTLGKKENEEAAWSLVKWVSSSKAAAEIKLKINIGLSAIKDNPYLNEQAKIDPVNKIALEILQTARKVPPFLPVPYEEEFNAKFKEVLAGTLEPKAFLDYMTQYAQALLDELKK